MSTETTNVVIENTTKLLSIGNAWVNDRDAEDDTKPKLTIRLDRDLGLSITLAANAQVLLFANKKRTGINPATNATFQDADYRVAVAIPAAIADREIARQQAAAEQRRASEASVATVETVTPAPIAA